MAVSRAHRVFEQTTSIERYDATSDGPELLPHLAVIHDSFGFHLRHSLSPFFESVSYIHADSAGQALALELLEEADIVFVLFAERFLYVAGTELPVGPMSPLVMGLLQDAGTAKTEEGDTRLYLTADGSAS